MGDGAEMPCSQEVWFTEAEKGVTWLTLAVGSLNSCLKLL